MRGGALTKPNKPLSERAWGEGKEAREVGKGRDACPYTRDQRPQSRAWLAGWESAGGPPVVHQAPPVKNNAPQIGHNPAFFVPPGQEIKLEYRRSQIPACPKCRRKQLDSGSQAVMVLWIKGGMVGLRCRADGCGEVFKVREVEN